MFQDGETALMHAAMCDHIDVVKYLLLEESVIIDLATEVRAL